MKMIKVPFLLAALTTCLAVHVASAEFYPDSVFSRECYQGNDPAACCPNECGGSARGKCVPLSELAKDGVSIDHLHEWLPFSRLCQCAQNFDGIGCGTCAKGKTGIHCDQELVRVRKSVLDLSKAEVARFIRGIDLLRQTEDTRFQLEDGSFGSKWGRIVNMHAWAICRENYASNCNATEPSGDTDINYAHAVPVLAPWHRVYTSYVEDEIEAALDDGEPFGFPYWPWGQQAATNRIFSPEMIGGNGDPENDYQVSDSAFATGLPVYDKEGRQQKTLVQRRFGHFAGASTLPTQQMVDYCADKLPFDVAPYSNFVRDGFRGCLEGWYGLDNTTSKHLHNRVHLWVGGTMIPTSISASDPAFFLHHSQVDRVYDRWLSAHPQQKFIPEHGAPLDTNANEPLRPWLPLRTPAQVHHPAAARLGYRYVDLSCMTGLDLACGAAKRAGVFACGQCVGKAEAQLTQCSEAEEQAYCEGA